jgi:hypothetical protein
MHLLWAQGMLTEYFAVLLTHSEMRRYWIDRPIP